VKGLQTAELECLCFAYEKRDSAAVKWRVGSRSLLLLQLVAKVPLVLCWVSA